jgi:predicted ferric reductase
LGYLAVFLASLSSLYLRELTQYFGRSFVKVHHMVSVTALVALTLHAVSAAWQSGTVAVFLPSFASLRSFLALGGRPAFWLIAIAALTALFRTAVGRNWRIIHWLNYLAFFLGTIHGQLIGTSFNALVVRIVSGLMALALLVVFVVKRVRASRRRRRRARK